MSTPLAPTPGELPTATQPYQYLSPAPKNYTPVYIGGAVGVILIFVSAVVYLVAVGRDVQQVVALLTAIGAPTIIGLMGLAQNARNANHLETVKRQTNGVLTNMNSRLSSIETNTNGAQ